MCETIFTDSTKSIAKKSASKQDWKERESIHLLNITLDDVSDGAEGACDMVAYFDVRRSSS